MEFCGVKKRGVMSYSNNGHASLDKEVTQTIDS